MLCSLAKYSPMSVNVFQHIFRLGRVLGVTYMDLLRLLCAGLHVDYVTETTQQQVYPSEIRPF